MNLHTYLIEKFQSYHPPAPEVVGRTKWNVTLDWTLEDPFRFLALHLLYKVEKNNKMPKWVVVYSGGKTTKIIDNLEPRYPHKFRVKVILKPTAVSLLADLALDYYGDETTIYEKLGKPDEEIRYIKEKSKKILTDIQIDDEDKDDDDGKIDKNNVNGDNIENRRTNMAMKNVVEAVRLVSGLKNRPDGSGDGCKRWSDRPQCVESQWSAETLTSTDTDGPSSSCFCMAVQCGYIKQIQSMLDERPELLEVVNPTNGLTPLATAVRKGDITTVRFLLSLGAEIDRPSLAGQTPLHLAVLAADIPLVELLLEKGADVLVRDWNGLRIEHYAVDSCDLDMLRYILEHGGELAARDYNGWTPLFRALCQGQRSSIVSELVHRGSDVNVVDNAGLPLTSVARLVRDRHGRSRDSIMCLVDSHYPHQKALANFTRLTKKIYNVQSLLKLN